MVYIDPVRLWIVFALRAHRAASNSLASRSPWSVLNLDALIFDIPSAFAASIDALAPAIC